MSDSSHILRTPCLGSDTGKMSPLSWFENHSERTRGLSETECAYAYSWEQHRGSRLKTALTSLLGSLQPKPQPILGTCSSSFCSSIVFNQGRGDTANEGVHNQKGQSQLAPDNVSEHGKKRKKKNISSTYTEAVLETTWDSESLARTTTTGTPDCTGHPLHPSCSGIALPQGEHCHQQGKCTTQKEHLRGDSEGFYSSTLGPATTPIKW